MFRDLGWGNFQAAIAHVPRSRVWPLEGGSVSEDHVPYLSLFIFSLSTCIIKTPSFPLGETSKFSDDSQRVWHLNQLPVEIIRTVRNDI